jgi:hypothetical protein
MARGQLERHCGHGILVEGLLKGIGRRHYDEVTMQCDEMGRRDNSAWHNPALRVPDISTMLQPIQLLAIFPTSATPSCRRRDTGSQVRHAPQWKPAPRPPAMPAQAVDSKSPGLQGLRNGAP